MGRRIKKDIFKDLNASTKSNDNYGTLFESMAKNKAFQELTTFAKIFYVYCRIQSQSKVAKACLYQHGADSGVQYDSNCDFVFPAKHLAEYGIDRRNADKYFKQLVQAGFIKIREQNDHRHKVNVYSFSDEWKNSS